MKTVRAKSLVNDNWYIYAIEGNRYTVCEIEPLPGYDDPPEGLLDAKEQMCVEHLREILEDEG